MTLTRKVLEAVARFAPDAEVDPLLHARGYIGRPMSRVDGRLKVSGGARFTAEFDVDRLAYAAIVCSTIARGRITSIDRSAAESSSGVSAVMTHLNAPAMKAPSLMDEGGPKSFAASNLPIMQSDRVSWNGQPVAVVVADTLEQAEHAASQVRIAYDREPSHVSFDDLKATAELPSDIMGEPAELSIGDPDAALAHADVVVDNVYRTPPYHHNAIEPHATIAAWDDAGGLTMFDSTQTVSGYRYALAEIFGLAEDRVRVVAFFVGGGFGGKAGLWQNTVLCAAAAKLVKRPVKLALSREAVFRLVGGRTVAEQRVALGARRDGRLTALIQTGITATTTHARYAEQCTFPARHLYATEHLFVGQKVVNLDSVANTWMRAPGESIGTFALESAIDELAHSLQIDPVEIRRINEPTTDPTNGTTFSGRHLNQAYERGAARFDWSRRPAEPRSQRDRQWLIGQGVATAYYPVYRFPGRARVRISADGLAIVQAAANEMGMGTATAQLQHAAERLGLPIDKVSFRYGDSQLPDSPMAGGSCQTVSIAAAVQAAIEKAHRRLLTLAAKDRDSPLAGLAYEQVVARAGGLMRADDVSAGATYESILRAAKQQYVEATARSGSPRELMKYSAGSYGAQFCEVRVNEESGETRISRWLGSFDCGRVVNPTTVVSQLRGGIIMGIGMALMEHTLFDERSGRIMNRSLAEYHVPVHLDVPRIEIIYNDIPDDHTPLGAHGVGEIGITGAAAAIANAVFNATGKRIRELPITLEKLM
jgi:xanthine dehydrogenase YagR molybdenum-binding subunit